MNSWSPLGAWASQVAYWPGRHQRRPRGRLWQSKQLPRVEGSLVLTGLDPAPEERQKDEEEAD